MTDSYPTLRADSVRLKPEFIRQHHLGSVTRRSAKKRILLEAALMQLRRGRPDYDVRGRG